MNSGISIVSRVAIIYCYLTSCSLTEAQLMLTATPGKIVVGTTSKLDVTCSYENGKNQTTQHQYTLTFLVLNRRSYGDNETGLAFVSMQYPSTAMPLPEANLTSLTGHVSASGVPSFTASWDNPTEKQVGTYTCEAAFLDSGGHTSKQFQVANGNFQLSHQYTVTMNGLRSQLKAAKECCSSLTQNLLEFQKWKSETVVGIRQVLVAYFRDVLGLHASHEHKGSIYVLSKTVQNNADKSQTSVVTQFFIGGRDDIHEGQWYWASSKKPVTYTSWGIGEPNNQAIENCLESTSASGFLWNDIACSNIPHLALCEIDNIPT